MFLGGFWTMKKNIGDSKKELSVKSKLLFNNLDMHYNVILNLDNKDSKRIKSLETIFQTYQMTLRPFIEDESKEYQDKINTKIQDKKEYITGMIESKVTVETLVMMVSPILNDLKSMVSTCKTSMESVNKLWGIE